MISKWFDKKTEALKLRQNGVSLRTIEASLGIPRSTLSGWFRYLDLDNSQKKQLTDNQMQALAKARYKASLWHNEQKQTRLKEAESDAANTIRQIHITKPTLDFALSMIYLGQRKKNDNTAIASSNPMVVRLVLYILKTNYNVTEENIVIGLQLRADQDAVEQKKYWSDQLSVPLKNFRRISFDKRTLGKSSYNDYHGVCVLYCSAAIQRKLIYLYNLFCQEVVGNVGV